VFVSFYTWYGNWPSLAKSPPTIFDPLQPGNHNNSIANYFSKIEPNPYLKGERMKQKMEQNFQTLSYSLSNLTVILM